MEIIIPNRRVFGTDITNQNGVPKEKKVEKLQSQILTKQNCIILVDDEDEDLENKKPCQNVSSYQNQSSEYQIQVDLLLTHENKNKKLIVNNDLTQTIQKIKPEKTFLLQSNISELRFYYTSIITHLQTNENIPELNVGNINLIDQATAVQRAKVVDWVFSIQINLQEKYQIKNQSIHNAIRMADRFFFQSQKGTLSLKMMKLIAITSFFIACQVEQIYPPDLGELKQFIKTENLQEEDILEAEEKVLVCLKFQLMRPNACNFLQIFSVYAEIDAIQKSVCNYLIEVSMLDVQMLIYNPSIVACASILVAFKLKRIQNKNENLEETLWNSIMENISGYQQQNLEECANELYMMLNQIPNSPYQNVLKQNKSPQLDSFLSVSPK